METAVEMQEAETEESPEEPMEVVTDQDLSESEKEEPAEGQEHSVEAVGEDTEEENTDPAAEKTNTADCQLSAAEFIHNGNNTCI